MLTVFRSPSFRNSCTRPNKTLKVPASRIASWATREMVSVSVKETSGSRTLICMLGGINPMTGNFHTLLMFRTDEELNTVRDLVHRMVERALALDGTCKSLVPPSALFPEKNDQNSIANFLSFSFRYRRTRRRYWKERFFGRGAWPGYCGSDEDDQAGNRPARDHESRKGKGSRRRLNSQCGCGCLEELFSSTRTTRMRPTPETESVSVVVPIVI
jgi:hypothetical protein